MKKTKLKNILFIIVIGLIVFLGIKNSPIATNDVMFFRPDMKRTDHIQAVVSSHNLATEAGLEILNKGGTAADAAVAIAATLSVVEPWFSSVMGGGTWALYYNAQTGEVTSLDGVGPIGSLATVSDYAARANQKGIHQSNVPGAWDGWMLWLDQYGVLGLDDVLIPAIQIAREGYPASDEMVAWVNREISTIISRPNAAAIYAPNGRSLRVGETVFQHNLANTFEAVLGAYNNRLSDGRSQAIQAARDYYYRGPLAEAIVDFSNRNSGYFILSDFNDFEAEIVEPIFIDYKDGIRVFQNPPNSQGITMLLALNIIKDYDFSGIGPDDTDTVHMQAEAIKLAFADRYQYIGDPTRIEIPIKDLLSDAYANRQRVRINMNRAMAWPIPGGDPIEGDHTTTFHITDRYGNAAAVTTSLGAEFLVIGDTGIHINNRMRMVSLEDENPNQLAPGYKVRHTSNPYMVLRNGKPYILGGNTGVDTQPQGQMQQFMHVVDFGLSAQEAIDRPRFVSTAFPAGSYPYGVGNTLQLESGFRTNLANQLRLRGHNVIVGAGTFGTANMLVISEDGYDVEIGAESRNKTAFGRKEVVK